MLNQEKQINGIKAIQDLVIEARTNVQNNIAYEKLFYFLDEIEHLTIFLYIEEDSTALFESELNRICHQYNVPYILKKYLGTLGK